MRKRLTSLSVALLIVSLLIAAMACSQAAEDSAGPLEFAFTFDQDEQQWTGGFADLPIDHEEHGYDVAFRHADIPVEGEESRGLLLTGNNHSDDLFMYVTRGFGPEDGLTPGTPYTVDVSFDLATNVPPGMMGIGGSPGESVYIKAGVVDRQPQAEEGAADGEGYYVMNLDTGSQSRGGEDMTVLGNAAKAEGEGAGDESFRYKPFQASFEVTTNQDGRLWVIIGADSGFEGISRLYLGNIGVTFTRADEAD